MAEQSNIEACLARVASRGSMGPQEAMQILSEVADRAEQMRATGEPDPFVRAAGDLANRLKESAAADRADAIRNAMKRAAVLEPIKASGSIEGAADRLRSLLFWTPGNTNPKANIQTLGRALTHDWNAQAWFGLKKAGLLKVAASREAFRDIARAFWALHAGEPSPRPVTEAGRKIAQVFKPIADNVRARLNEEGARIGDARDYAGNTSHDAFLMRRGGRDQPRERDADQAFAKWWSWTRPRLADKTFDDLALDQDEVEGESREAAEQRFGRSVWEALVTGIHKPPISMDHEPSLASQFEGTRNLARRISENRVLLWKDADAWVDYMERYGKPRNFYDLMVRQFQGAGRGVALMHFLGTNPADNLGIITRRLQEHFRSDVDGVKAFGHSIAGGMTQPNLSAVMAQLDGSALLPQNEGWARIGNTARQYYEVTMLGGVGVTHLASTVATFPSTARHLGVNSFAALGRLITGLVPDSLRPEERADALRHLGAYADGARRMAFDPFGQGWSIPGQVAAIHSAFLRATALPYIMDHAKNAMKELTSNELAANRGRAFDQLEPHLQNGLQGYDIGPQDWDLLRAVEPMKTPSGLEYLLPIHAGRMDAAGATELLRARGLIDDQTPPAGVTRQLGKYRQHIADNLAMLIQDAADHSTVTPGAREAAMWRGATRPGSPFSEAVQVATMFKAWPLAVMHQAVGREMWQSLSRMDAAKGILTVVGFSMLGGYMRMAINDLASGRPVRIPRDGVEAAKIAAEALALGGGLGLFGDFVFGEADRQGASRLSAIGGPLGMDMDRVYDLFNRWKQNIGTDRKMDFWPELAHLAVDHVPMQNLIWLKSTLDYLLWFHLYEAVKPGWWERTNQRMQRESGRTMMGYRPGAPIPYAPPYLQGMTQQ